MAVAIKPGSMPFGSLAGSSEASRDLLDGERAVGLGRGEHAFLELEIARVDLEHMRGDGARLGDDLSVAMWKAEPAMVAEREPPVPSPKNTSSVSPWMYCTSLGSRPSRSQTICLNTVSWPWPWLLEPENSVTVPERSKRISAPSMPGAAARSMVLEMPKPRSLPCFARLRLARLEALGVGKLQRQVHVLLELAAVVGEGQPGLERHGVGRNVVAPAQLGRIDAEFVGGEIDHALDHVGRFRPAVAAIGPHRIGVGEHPGDVDMDRRRAVDAGERAGIDDEGRHGVLQIGADGGDGLHAQARGSGRPCRARAPPR